MKHGKHLNSGGDWIVHSIAGGGSNRGVDIICYKEDIKQGYIIDPTIKIRKTNNKHQK